MHDVSGLSDDLRGSFINVGGGRSCHRSGDRQLPHRVKRQLICMCWLWCDDDRSRSSRSSAARGPRRTTRARLPAPMMTTFASRSRARPWPPTSAPPRRCSPPSATNVPGGAWGYLFSRTVEIREKSRDQLGADEAALHWHRGPLPK